MATTDEKRKKANEIRELFKLNAGSKDPRVVRILQEAKIVLNALERDLENIKEVE